MKIDKQIQQRFKIEKILKESLITNTYLAIDKLKKTKKKYIVKQFKLSKSDSIKFLDDIEKETKTLINLSNDNIPRLIEYFIFENDNETNFCLVQEYISGKNLYQKIESGIHLKEYELIDIAIDIVDILGYLHSYSPPIIHQDIRPGNIIIKPRGKVYLIDLGSTKSKLETQTLKVNSSVDLIKNHSYISLEQLEGKSNKSSDIYSLGLTLIYLLSHKEPNQLLNENNEIDFKDQVNISVSLKYVLDKMTNQNIEKRYQNVEDLKIDLKKIQSGKEIILTTKQKVGSVIIFTIAILASYFFFQLFYESYNEKDKTYKKKEIDSKANEVDKGSLKIEKEVNLKSDFKLKILYENKIVSNIKSKPNLWIRNEKTGKKQTGSSINYRNGIVKIKGLIKGKYFIGLNIDENKNNPKVYPDDYYGGLIFDSREEGQKDFHIKKIIHLIKPENNNNKIVSMKNEFSEKIKLENPIRFEWKNIGEGVEYNYNIRTMEKYKKDGKNKYRFSYSKSDTILDNFLEINLPKNKDNEIYLFRLDAIKDNQKIGLLMTHGQNSLNWDYRFRVI